MFYINWLFVNDQKSEIVATLSLQYSGIQNFTYAYTTGIGLIEWCETGFIKENEFPYHVESNQGLELINPNAFSIHVNEVSFTVLRHQLIRTAKINFEKLITSEYPQYIPNLHVWLNKKPRTKPRTKSQPKPEIKLETNEVLVEDIYLFHDLVKKIGSFEKTKEVLEKYQFVHDLFKK